MRRTKRSCCCFLHFKQSTSDCQIHAGSEICLNYRTPDLMLYHAIFRSNTLTEKKLLSYCNSNHKFTYQWSYLSRDVSCQTHESILQNTFIWNKAKSDHCFLLKEIMNNWEKQRKTNGINRSWGFFIRERIRLEWIKKVYYYTWSRIYLFLNAANIMI